MHQAAVSRFCKAMSLLTSRQTWLRAGQDCREYNPASATMPARMTRHAISASIVGGCMKVFSVRGSSSVRWNPERASHHRFANQRTRCGDWSVHSTGTPKAAASCSTHCRASSAEAQRRVAGARRDAVGRTRMLPCPRRRCVARSTQEACLLACAFPGGALQQSRVFGIGP